MTPRHARPPWLSAARALGAIVAVTATIAVFVTVRDPATTRTATVDTPGRRAVAACGPSLPQPPVGAPSAPVPPPAVVSIPGATEVDLGGSVVTDLVAGDGQAWASVVEPDADPTAPVGRVARIDATSGAVVEVIPVVDGCSVSAMALGEAGLWIGTCDELAAPDAGAGGLVIQVDPASGGVVRQVALPARCVADVTTGDGSISVSDLALTGQTARVWRVDPATGAVTEIRRLVDEALGGLAATDDGLWTQARGSDGDEAVLTDPASGAEQASVPAEDAVLAGAHGDGVWFRRPDAIVQRHASTGAVRTETPLPGVRTLAVGASGAWFEQVTPESTTITIGRVDPATGAVTFTVRFESPGLDRTGRPFGVDLAADETGVWVVHVGRLFRVPLPGAPPPPAPPTAPPSSAPAPTTTTTSTTSTTTSTTTTTTTVPASTTTTVPAPAST